MCSSDLKEGYLARDKSTLKYRIGLKNLILGRNALREAGFRAVSEPTLYRLAVDTGLAANLAVLEGNRVILLDRVEGPAFVKAAVDQSTEDRGRDRVPHGFKEEYMGREHRDIGSELPVYTTALGKVLLANISDSEFAEYTEHVPPATSGIQVGELASELQQIREKGYCFAKFEPHNESCALAAPIFDGNETVKAGVAVSCKRHLPIWNDERALSEMVKEAAWEISCRLHYPKLLNEGRRDTGAIGTHLHREVRGARRPS